MSMFNGVIVLIQTVLHLKWPNSLCTQLGRPALKKKLCIYYLVCSLYFAAASLLVEIQKYSISGAYSISYSCLLRMRSNIVFSRF